MEDEFDLDFGGSASCYVDEQSKRIIQIPITGIIGAAETYNDILYTLRSANPQDEVIFLINSGGGHVEGALHIVSGIYNCAAHSIKAVITGTCGSAATYIFFACSQWEIPPYATMLLHTTSYGTEGMTEHIYQVAEHEKEHLDLTSNLFYEGFLTKGEITQLKRGHQYYFLGAEIEQRLNKRIKLLTKKHKEVV